MDLRPGRCLCRRPVAVRLGAESRRTLPQTECGHARRGSEHGRRDGAVRSTGSRSFGAAQGGARHARQIYPCRTDCRALRAGQGKACRLLSIARRRNVRLRI